MKKRDEPREVPDRPHYINVEAGGRTWTFRLPPERKRLDLVRLVGSVAADADADPDVAQQMEQAGMIGVVLGRCWFDREFDLECVENGSPLNYGHEVNDELYEEGFDLVVAATLGKMLLDRMQSSLIGAEEVQDTVDFSGRPLSGGSGGRDSISR